MKNVTKILTAVTLCAALFASDQRIDALGGNAAFWPGDEANIANFPARVNDHAFVQLTGVGGDDNSAALLWNDNGTTWGFDWNNGGDDMVNLKWGKNGMGVAFGLASRDDDAGNTLAGNSLGFGKTLGFGEIGFTMWSSSEDVFTAATEDVVTTWVTGDDMGLGLDYTVGPLQSEADCIAAGGATVAASTGDLDGNNIVPAYCGYAADGTSTEAGDPASTATTDKDNMALSFAKDCDFWAFDTMIAGYSSGDDNGDGNSSSNMSVDMVSHMDAGGAAVVWGLGIDMDDTGADDGASTSLANTLGVESNMTDWATLRAGVNHTYTLSADAGGTGAGDLGWAFGLGFNWGGLTADYSVDGGIFKDPVGTVTGYGGALTDHAVTFTYNF